MLYSFFVGRMFNMIDINLSKISKSYGTNKVLNDINLTIDKGDRVALIGFNGV